jgi:hypothetical protein
MPEPIECPKCGVKMDPWRLRRKNTFACLVCREPIQALIELDKCDWSSGDFYPGKDEQG